MAGPGTHVQFSPSVHVREFASLSSTGSGGGQFMTRLTFTGVVSEYDGELKASSYTPPEGEAFPVSAATTASSSAGASVFSPPLAPRGPAPASPFAAPQPHLQLQQQQQHQQQQQQQYQYQQQQQQAAAAAVAQPQPPPVAKLIDNWHVKPDGCVYQGPNEHSSAIANAHRRIVLTNTGSYYTLGRLDAGIARVLAAICPQFNPEDPLRPDTRQQLLYAERVVYGQAAAPLAQLLASLRAAQAALGAPEVIAPQFVALRQVLYTLGVYE